MACQSCGHGSIVSSSATPDDKLQLVDMAKTLGSLAVFNTRVLEKSKKNQGSLNTRSDLGGNGDDLIFDSLEMSEKFYKMPSSTDVSNLKPWKENKYHFKTVHISLIALIKMTLHARSGGSIEIMGVMTGKVFGSDMVIMDCYPLPVEGSESRVNAQNEAYEFMLQYLNALKSIKGREENIIGWYHSHPGFGCWLSGIDVQTQALNQGFQDPYVAVVIDPERSIKQGLVEIGAFRTLPEDKDGTSTGEDKQKNKNMGFHQDKYYSLNIRLFESPNDRDLLELLANEFWFNSLENLSKEDYSKSLKKLETLKKSLNDEKKDLGNGKQVIANMISNSSISSRQNMVSGDLTDLDLMQGSFQNVLKSSIGDDREMNRFNVYDSIKKSSRPLSLDSISPPDSKRRLTHDAICNNNTRKAGLGSNSVDPLARELKNGASKSVRDLQIMGIQQMKKVIIRGIQEDLFM